jgi:hypothetical protein
MNNHLIYALVAVGLAPSLITRLGPAIETGCRHLRPLPSNLFDAAVGVITRDHKLRPHQLATLTGASLLLSAAGVALAVCAFALVVPTIGPMLGVTSVEALQFEAMADFGRSSAVALVLAPVILGACVLDLGGFSEATPLAYATRGRLAALGASGVTLCWSLVVLLAAGLYRAVIDLEAIIGFDRAASIATWLAAFILASADTIAVVAIAFAFLCIEPLLRALCALVMTILGLLVMVVVFLLELLRELLQALGDLVGKTTSSVGGAAARGRRGVLTRIRAFANVPEKSTPDPPAALNGSATHDGRDSSTA